METSESGAPIHRHEKRDRDFDFAVGDSENIEKITGHIERHIGPVTNVFHELISDLVHVDIHLVAPTETRPCHTLVTSGMSDRAMQAPEEYPELGYSELVIGLPPDWPMDQESWKKEEHYWPVRMLKFLSRFPHEYETWLWAHHTVPNGNPPSPFASNTEMSGVILLPPIAAPEKFYELEIDASKTIHFHGVVPLHSDEMDFKLREGSEALFEGFDRDGVSELLNPGRPSTLRKKRSWFSLGRKR